MFCHRLVDLFDAVTRVAKPTASEFLRTGGLTRHFANEERRRPRCSGYEECSVESDSSAEVSLTVRVHAVPFFFTLHSARGLLTRIYTAGSRLASCGAM